MEIRYGMWREKKETRMWGLERINKINIKRGFAYLTRLLVNVLKELSGSSDILFTQFCNFGKQPIIWPINDITLIVIK